MAQFLVGLLMVCLAVPFTARAGVPEAINPRSGLPLGWIDPAHIPYQVDPGPLGRLSAAQAQALVEAMIGVWEETDSTAMHMEFAGPLAEDVTAANIGDYVNGTLCAANLAPGIPSMQRGESPIIFDHDGAITDLIAGVGASRKIVGRSGFRCYAGPLDDPTGVTQAFIVMNGRFLDGANDPEDLSTNAYAGVLLHELGHFLGLHHSMVNEPIFNEILLGARAVVDSRYVPVMYPLVLPSSTASTVLKPDDVAGIEALYPNAAFTKAAVSITGTIRTAAGDGFRGANVVARRRDDPLCRAVATVSGRFCTPLVEGANHVSVAADHCIGSDAAFGAYRLEGLTAGDYSVEVSEVVADGGARANMFPKQLGADLPGPAEYYNDGDAVDESVNAQTILHAAAGEIVHDIDVRLGSGADGPRSFAAASVLTPASTPCVTDPVSYDQLLAMVAQETGENAAQPTADAGGGCALMKDQTASNGVWIIGMLGLLVSLRARRAKQSSVVLLLLLIPCLCVPTRARADSSLPVSPRELAQSAGQIFQGRCIDVTTGPEAHGVAVSEVTYEVTRMVKGAAAAVVTFRVAGATPDRIGDENVLFLYPESPWGLTSPVGGSQGRFPVVTDIDGAQTVRDPFISRSAYKGVAVLEARSTKHEARIPPDALLDRMGRYLRQ